MISRIVIKGIASAARLCIPSASLLRTPAFNFARVTKVSSHKKTVETEIKAEEENLTDLTSYQEDFKKEGWSVSQEGTLVELAKKVGNYDVRLLSNIKSPTNLGEEEGEKQPEKAEGEEQEDFNDDFNEVTILVTKAGNPKTMVVNTIVTQGFEITSINFDESLEAAKAHRNNVFESNQYTGPEIETLSDELFEGIYGFLEADLGIKGETLDLFVDYCIDSEQTFYIKWLKDMKNIY